MADLTPVAMQILSDVRRTMRDAEELGGLEGQDYLRLMQAISAEALERHSTYAARLPSEDGSVMAHGTVVHWHFGAKFGVLLADGTRFVLDDTRRFREGERVRVRFHPDDQFAREVEPAATGQSSWTTR